MSAFICLQFGQDNMTTPIAQSTSENWQMFAATNCRRKLDLALPTWQGAQESESLGEAWRSYLSGFESDWRLVWTSSRTHIIWPKEQQIYLSCPNEQAHPQIQDPGRTPHQSHLSYEDVIGSRCALCERLSQLQEIRHSRWPQCPGMTAKWWLLGCFWWPQATKAGERERGGESLEGDKFIS